MRPDETLSFGPFRLIPAQRLLVRDGVPIAIGGRALDLLIALTDRPGEVVSARELMERVWRDVTVEEANLRVVIAALRKALGDGKDGTRLIATVAGRGYTFVAPLQRSSAVSPLPVVPSAISAGPGSLPAAHQMMVGRDETVAVLSELLLARRFVSIVGPGGIGKTTVSLAIAHSLRSAFGEDAICFVDLGSITDPTFVVDFVASALGCLMQGPDSEGAILAFLSDKRFLIVLDNCEHVIESVSLLAERLFLGAPLAHLMTTSREALRASGENVHLLLPLQSPTDNHITAAEALNSSAVRLFMERAAASGYRGQLGDADATIVAEICRRLDGIALAIELAASRVGSHGIQGTADLLDDGANLLLQGRRSALPRHRTLKAMLDWSFALLTTQEQLILSRLSVFVGQFTLEAAHSVGANTEDDAHAVTNAIASLVDKSLVTIFSISGSVYYRLLDTTRTYAAAKLAEIGESDSTARRHARYFTDFIKANQTRELAFRGYGGAAYAPHMGNVRHALERSFSSPGQFALGVELAALSAPLFLGTFSLLSECKRWSRRALDVLPESDRGTLRELELQRALALSSMYLWESTDDVRTAIERGLELSVLLKEWRHHHYLLIGLNVLLVRRGDFGGALEVAQRSADIAESLDSPPERVMAEWMLGASYHLAGDQAAALRHCETAFSLASDVGTDDLKFFGYDYDVRGLGSLARSLWLSGFPDRAREVTRLALDKIDSFEHPVLYCAVLLDVISVMLWCGELDEASTQVDRAIIQANRYSLGAYRAAGLALKGELLIAQKNPAAGVDSLREALKVMGANQYHVTTLATWRALAEGLTHLGRLDEALATINEAIVRVERVSSTLWLPDLLRARAEILLAQSRPNLSAAEESLLDSMGGARAQSALGWELRAAILLARIWIEQGKTHEARATLEELIQRYTEGFGTTDLTTARRILDALGAP